MRADKQIANRMREILTKDKMGIKEGFFDILSKDMNNLLRNYFDLEKDAKITIEQSEQGVYKITVEGIASKIKQFDTTKEMAQKSAHRLS